MSAPDLATEAALAGDYPSQRFNQRERKLLESVKTYADNLAPNNVITTQGDLIQGDSSGDAERLAIGASGTMLSSDGTSASWAQVSLENLDSGIAPAYVAKYAGKHTTSADASDPFENVVSVPGVLSGDIVMATVQTAGASPVSILAALPDADQITLRFSADPSTDHIVSYVVFRAAS